MLPLVLSIYFLQRAAQNIHRTSDKFTLSELGVSSSDAETLGSDFNSAFMMAGSATTPFICAPVRITVTAQGTQLYRVFGNRARGLWTRVNPGTITLEDNGRFVSGQLRHLLGEGH